MSLENEIAELKAAIQDLTAVIKESGLQAPPAKKPRKKKADPSPADQEQTTPAATQEQSPQTTASPESSPAEPASPPQQSAPSGSTDISYQEIMARASEVSRVLGANAGRIPVLLQRFGAGRLSALMPDQYADFMAGLDRLAAGEDPATWGAS